MSIYEYNKSNRLLRNIGMKNFGNICFIHHGKDSYEVCYLKQFFKWIGFSYFTYIPDSFGVGADILKEPENAGFDIVVSLNHAAQSNDISICDFYGNKFVTLDDTAGGVDKLLELLITKIFSITLEKSDISVLNELVQIYNKNNMDSVLYEYTIILMEDVGEPLFTRVSETIEKVLGCLDNLLQNIQQQSNMAACSFIEYVLYAKYSCQRKMNELYALKKWAPRYLIPDMLKNLEQIYQYDKSFYRIEYLKAKVAEQDKMYKVYAKAFYHKAIKKSAIKLCNSYLFYQLGKWFDCNKQIYTSGQAYYRAYECNPTNIKAIFKLVVDAKRKKEKKLEKKYLELIVNNWKISEGYKNNLPLMEMEYAYKAYMLLDRLERKNMQDTRFCFKAKDILNFTQNLYQSTDSNSFILKMYKTDVERKRVCYAIASRMDINCKKLLGEQT